VRVPKALVGRSRGLQRGIERVGCPVEMRLEVAIPRESILRWIRALRCCLPREIEHSCWNELQFLQRDLRWEHEAGRSDVKCKGDGLVKVIFCAKEARVTQPAVDVFYRVLRMEIRFQTDPIWQSGPWILGESKQRGERVLTSL
jgi:hypothetical protein